MSRNEDPGYVIRRRLLIILYPIICHCHCHIPTSSHHRIFPLSNHIAGERVLRVMHGDNDQVVFINFWS